MEWRSQRAAIIAGMGLLLMLSGPLPMGRADEPAPPPAAAPSGNGDANPTPAAPDAGKASADGHKSDPVPPAAAGKDSGKDAGKDAGASSSAGKDTGRDAGKDSGKDAGGSKDGSKPDQAPAVKGASGSHPGAAKATGAATSGRAKPGGRSGLSPTRPKRKDLSKILGPLPHKRVSMDFRGMDVDNVLLMYSTWAGVTIVKDPGLTGTMNLIQGQEVSLLDAFKILEAVLNQKGFTIDRDGPLLKVAPKPSEAPPGPPPGAPSAPGPPPKPETPPDDRITKIFPLIYASAQSVARIVNDLYGAGGGGASGGGPPGQGGPPPGQPGGPPGGPGGGAKPGAPASKKTSNVKATADFDTNQVIVSGDPVLMEDVEKVIKDLDHKTEIPLETKSYKILYAEVNDVATQVGAVLTSISGTGRTSPFQDVPFERRTLGGGGGGGYNPYGGSSNTGPQTSAGGRVISDPRTNTLTVIASADEQVQVKKIIDALDQKVEYALTTFILPMKHLDANEATFMLGQLFKKQDNNNGFPFFFFGGGGNNNQNQIRQRRRLGDSQSPRPSEGSRTNNNPFGFSSFDGSDSSGSSGGSASAASASVASASAASEQPGGLRHEPITTDYAHPADPQLSAPVLAADPGGAGAFPIPTSVTLDGEQLAQWWNQNQSDQTTTGRDAEGHVRPLVDLSGKVTIVPDLNSNSLIINTNPSNLDALKQVLEMIDQQPAQVLIEGIIVEASLDASTKLGVTLTWNEAPAFGSKSAAQQTTVTLPAPAATGGLSIHGIGGNFDAIVQAIKSDQRFNVLSTPRILTQNNRQAAITVGQQVPILTSQTSFGNSTNNITFKPVGVTLDVTPHISADGYVNIEVGEDADEIQSFVTLSNNQVPVIAHRSAETTVTAKDGQTIVLGGLIRNSIQNNHTRIPILGDLPLIGSFFRSKDKATSKTELMLFMRARIVRYDDEVEDLTNQQGAEAAIKPDSRAGKHLDLKLPGSGAPLVIPQSPKGKSGTKGTLPPTTTGPL